MLMNRTFVPLALALFLSAALPAQAPVAHGPRAEPNAPAVEPPRYDGALTRALRAANAAVRRSVVEIRSDESWRPVLYGTVVLERDLVLTKLSALPDKPLVGAGRRAFAAEVVARDEAYDLVLLRAPGLDLPPVRFERVTSVPIGSIVVCAADTESPAGFGIVTAPVVTPRAFLGVSWDRRRSDDGVLILEVVPDSAAQRAGLEKGDRILSVNGQKMEKAADFSGLIGRFSPGDRVALRLRRGEGELSVAAVLGVRPRSERPQRSSRRSSWFARGLTRAQRDGFPRALPHDANVNRQECGAPITTVDGRVVGLTIARSARVRSLALLGADIDDVLKRMKPALMTSRQP